MAENRNDVSLQPVYRTHFLTHAGTNPVPNDEVILSPLARCVNRGGKDGFDSHPL